MDIDKFYRTMGMAIKRIFHQTIRRPLKNFNVDNRALKKIEKPNAAPWHDTTKKMVDQLKKDSQFKRLDTKDDTLLDRLKSVKVDSHGPALNIEFRNESTPTRKLPQNRFGPALPYVFYKPETIPIGKITVLQALELLLSHKNDAKPVPDLAREYNLKEADVENLLKYVDVFRAVGKDKKEIPLYLKEEAEDLQLEAPESQEETSQQKTIPDKT